MYLKKACSMLHTASATEDENQNETLMRPGSSGGIGGDQPAEFRFCEEAIPKVEVA